MGAFAEAQTCRRLVLLNYFGEGRQEPCGNCDICLDPPKQYDGSTDAQIALSTIGRVNQRFGMGYVVEVIRGANTVSYTHLKIMLRAFFSFLFPFIYLMIFQLCSQPQFVWPPRVYNV